MTAERRQVPPPRACPPFGHAVCCGETLDEADRRAAALGEAGARMLRMGVTGTPGDVAARLAELRASGADTVYFHLYDVADLDDVRLLGHEVLPRLD